MSSVIDERVVEMRFNNSNFERNAKASIGTVNKLKESLNFSGAQKNLEQFEKTANKFKLDNISTAIETVSYKFDALSIAAITAMQRITNNAIDTGKQIVSALTIKPIKKGFDEYETQINAVQTILANTEHQGTNLEQVNAALDELNTYADKTIYNFTEMTKNIGTFTAAGVNLESSVESIKGIANLAAVSGSTSQQASTAMYQLSQALAAGRVSLQDWNSVVNAGMGGKVFQNALIRTSELLQTGAQSAIDQYGSFRESLTRTGWLTTEVLTETLKQFAGVYSEADLINQGFTAEQAKEIAQMATTAENAATKVKTLTQLWDTLQESAQSGWTQTWEILIGDFEEAKALFTEVSDSIGKMITDSANARNSLLEEAFGGSEWKNFMTSLKNVGIEEDQFANAFKDTAKKYGVSIESIIEEEGSLEKAIKKHGWGSYISETLDNLSNGAEVTTTKVADMTSEFDKYSKVVEDVLNNKYGSGAERVKALTDAGFDYNVAQGLVNKQLANGAYTIEDFKDLVGELTEEEKQSISITKEQAEALKTASENLSKPSGRELLVDSLRNALSGLEKVMAVVQNAWSEVFPPATADMVYSFVEQINELSKSLILTDDQTETLKTILVGVFSVMDTGLYVVKNVASAIYDLTFNIFDLDNIFVKAITTIAEWATSLRTTVKEGTAFEGSLDNVREIASLLADAFRKLMSFDLSPIGNAFKSLGTLIQTFFSEFISNLGGLELSLESISTSGLAVVLAGIAGSIKNFIKTPIEGFSSIVEGITGIIDGVRDALAAYQSTLKADALQKIAIAIGIMAASMLVLSSIDSEKVSSSLSALTVSIGELVGALGIMTKFGSGQVKMVAFAPIMIAIASAVLVLSIALKAISSIDIKQMGVGLLGITVLMTELTGAAIILSKYAKHFTKGATGLILFSAAIAILATVVKNLSSVNPEGFQQGLIGITALIIEMSLATIALSKYAKHFTKGATGLILFSAAIVILGKVLQSLSSIKPEEFQQGLIGITALIIEMSLATIALSKYAKHFTKGATGLILFSAAIAILATVVKNLSTLNPKDLTTGLIGITILIGELVAAAVIMSKFASGFIIASASAVAFASAILILSKAVTQLGQLSGKDLAKGLGGVTVLLVEMAVALNFMKGTLGGSAALLVAASAFAIFVPAVALLGSLPIPVLVAGLVTMAAALTIIGVAGALITPIIPSLLTLSVTMLSMSASTALLGAGLLLVGTGLSAAAVGLASLTVAVVENLGPLLTGLFDVITQAAPALGDAVIALIVMLDDILRESIPDLVDMLLVVILETLKALDKYSYDIVAVLVQIFVDIVNALTDSIDPVVQSITNLAAKLFTSVFDAFFNLDPDILMKMLTGMGIVALILGALNLAAPLIPPAMTAVLGLAALVAEIGVLMVAFGALAQIPGLIWIIDEGGQLLQAIGSAIGNLVGGIVGGIAEGISADMPAIGTNLSQFMTNLGPFLEGANSLNSGSLASIQMLADSILTLTKADILNGLAAFGGKETTLESFGKELAAFGPYMKQYSDSVAGIDQMAVTNSATATKALSEAAKNLPKDPESLAGWWSGAITLTQFGEELKSFGPAIKAYSDSVSGIDNNAVASSATAAKALSEAASNLPKSSESVVGWWSGTITLADFAEGLKAFGPAIKEYANSVAGIDSAAVSASATAAKSMAEIASNLPEKDGTVKSWFTGNITLSDFADELKTFGPGLKSFADSVAGINTYSIVNAANAVSTLTTAKVNLSQNGGDLAAFGNELTKLSDILSEFAADTNDNVNNELVKMYEAAGGNVVKGFTKGIDDNLPAVKQSGTDIGETVLAATQEALDIHSPSGKFAALANFSIQGYVQEMNRGQNTVKKTMAKFSDVIVGSFDVDSITKSMRNFGMSLTDIMANDIFANVSGKDLKAETEAYNAQLESMNTHLQELKTNLSEIKKAKGEESDEYIAASAEIKAYNKEIDKYKENFSNYKQQQTAWNKFIDTEKLEEGKKEFDNLIADYKAGRIQQSDFDKKYTNLLGKYTDQQVELLEYSSGKMKAYVEDELGTVVSNFEKKISDIQSKMDSTKDNLNKSFADQFTFKTNQDTYDEIIKKYDDATEKLNKDLEYEKRLHGENSRRAQLYQRQLDDLAREKDEFDTKWKESKIDNSEIIDVTTTDAWVKQTEKSMQAVNALKTLQERNISKDMIDYLGTLDADSMRILATKWASMTDRELQVVQDQYNAMKTANNDLTKILYGNQVLDAQEQFVIDYTAKLNQLPETAKAIGMEIVQNLTNPFTEETTKTLKTFKESGENMTNVVKAIFGIQNGGQNAKSEEGTQIGNALGNGVVDGTVNTIRSRANEMVHAILDIFKSVNIGSTGSKFADAFLKALTGQNFDLAGSVRPVRTSNQGTLTRMAFGSASLSPELTVQTARTINSGVNSQITRRNQNLNSQETSRTETIEKSFSFVQNNYSPEPLDRLTILRDTKQMFSVAKSKFS